ncbi:hypothetical protein KSP40_PGU006078 [Platanthera guangdongensis]|uniref:Glucosamine-phosphate N-acetyltransferase n=1 Tax=Platanthera guangdongensis TaxID=2320717 RepID=A0ABR2MYC0_9ASPA
MFSLFSVGSAALPPFSSQNRHRLRRSHPPISISTNPSHVDILRLRDLFASSGHSCHRFPVPSGDGLVEPTDPGKLRLAIYHSFIVISVFCRSNFLPSAGGGSNTIPEETSAAFGFQDFFERNFRAPGPDHHLIGFGRAVSDRGLTASIHDVVRGCCKVTAKRGLLEVGMLGLRQEAGGDTGFRQWKMRWGLWFGGGEAIGIGGAFWSGIEKGMGRCPLIVAHTVYCAL